MVLSQRRIRRKLKTKWFGTPFENVKLLDDFNVEVGHFLLADIETYLKRGIPVIAGVCTSSLTYWNGEDTDHVFVILAIEDSFVVVNDPILPHENKQIPVTEFELARIAFDDLCAAIQVP